MTKTRKELEALNEALDDVPTDAADDRAVVEALGIDVEKMAAEMRAKIAEADRRDREERVAEARRAYAEEVEQLERRRIEAKPTREEQLAVFRSLVARAPAQAVAMHFHKYESATDDELAELIRALRHLLGEDE
jgi:hypothetical protein